MISERLSTINLQQFFSNNLSFPILLMLHEYKFPTLAFEIFIFSGSFHWRKEKNRFTLVRQTFSKEVQKFARPRREKTHFASRRVKTWLRRNTLFERIEFIPFSI